jgi:hypothetical protein
MYIITQMKHNVNNLAKFFAAKWQIAHITPPRQRSHLRQASLREGGGFLQSKKTEGERVSLF